MRSQEKELRQRLDQIFHSIRFRLVLWFVVILGAVMGIFSGIIYWRQAQDVRSTALGQLNFTMERILGLAHEREGAGEQGSAGSLFPNLAQGISSDVQGNEVIAVQSPDGNIQQNNGVLTIDQIQQLQLPESGWSGIQQARVPDIQGIENNRYLFINPAIMENGQVAGFVLVGVPLDATNQLGRLLVSLVIGNLVTLVIALTGGFWLADRAMRPVQTITRTAQQISETDLHKRLRLPGKDELSELGKTFDGMLDRLQAAFERQRQFTADASHELRTPLTIIDLEASRGLSAHRPADEYEQILRTIRSENQTMIRLVHNLLALARMDAGQMALHTNDLDLSNLVSEVIERMEPLAAAQGVTLEIGELPEITIQGDLPTLVQMVTNLMENAIKYSSTVGKPRVNISTGKQQIDGKLQAWVRVSDNGIGIPAEYQEHIFDRFYQADPARNRQVSNDGEVSDRDSSGAGLGLAIAQWIAHAHQGDIRVESVVGEGSTFEVMLPVMRQE